MCDSLSFRLSHINLFYKLPFLSANKRITIGPDNKISADESNCPTTCKLTIMMSFKLLFVQECKLGLPTLIYIIFCLK